MTERLMTWVCQTCKATIADGDGYIHVVDWKASQRMLEARDWTERHRRRGNGVILLSELLAPPPPVPWMVHHAKCEPEHGEDGPEYWIDVESARTMDQFHMWSLHVLEKNWVSEGTNWLDFAEAAISRWRDAGLSAAS